MHVADQIRAEVANWPSLAKYSSGEQLTQAADSIAANISTGHGRYYFKENQQFCYYARGSLQETHTWLEKARNRQLLSEDRLDKLSNGLIEIRRMLNGYIRSIGKQNKNA